MKVSSMTGFARTEGQNETSSWNWEIKSVNAKGLDVRCRLAIGFDAVEATVRERVAAIFRRGNVFVNLTSSRIQTANSFQINQQALNGMIALVPEVEGKFGSLAPPTVTDLLNLRGVLEPVEDHLSDDEKTALNEDVLEDFNRAITLLAEMRADEGARLAKVLNEQLDTIDRLCRDAAKLAAAQPDALKKRLHEQLIEILDSVPTLSEERLAQEVALLVTKADIREELDRLKSHEEASRALLMSGGAVGRKLDFLCQELNREANTLCSKSSDVELTRVGLDLKAVIEQFREQIQNIE